MEHTKENFSKWLSCKLQELKVDESVFSTYIMGILEGDDSSDDKIEAISSVLNCDNEENVSYSCKEILEKWEAEFNDRNETSVVKENLENKLTQLLEKNILKEENETAPSHTYTLDELKIREAILSQYSHRDAPDEEFEEVEDTNDGIPELEKNVNALTVHQAEKEKRERAKIENQKKKEKDKEDRQKQKLTAQEKKDARRKRAQKVEHRRH